MSDNTQPSFPHTRRHKRGYLPHIESAGAMQFVTFRLADSLPNDLLQSLKRKLQTRRIDEIEYHRQVDKALDLGRGPTFLRDPGVAKLVAAAIMNFHGERYDMHAWVLMPNHGHLLFTQVNGHTVSSIMHSLKSFTATAANKYLNRDGRFWSPDYFDRYIRDKRHYLSAKKYIDENPVNARLCGSPEDWPWGSAGYKVQ